jgi:hypothetical protein
MCFLCHEVLSSRSDNVMASSQCTRANTEWKIKEITHHGATLFVCVHRAGIRVVGGGVQLGPFCTSATSWSIVLAPGDYEEGEFGGMIIGRGNRSTRTKLAPAPLCSPQIPQTWPGTNPGRRGGKSETNRLSYGTALTPSMWRSKLAFGRHTIHISARVSTILTGGFHGFLQFFQ